MRLNRGLETSPGRVYPNSDRCAGPESTESPPGAVPRPLHGPRPRTAEKEILLCGEWDREIDRQLDAAGIILLLVSADFPASDYCWDKEVTRAIEHHDKGEATVVPVMLRSCDWKGAPFAKLQGLPEDMKPVNSWDDRDSAWTNVAKGIRSTAEAMAS